MDSNKPNTHTTDINDSDSNKVDVNEDEDDLITLTGCDKVTRWKFPQHTIICPVEKCSKQFAVRSDAIAHYKSQHAHEAILCPICKIPIFATLTIFYKIHFMKAHPNMKFPLDDLGEDENEDEQEDTHLKVNRFLLNSIFTNKVSSRLGVIILCTVQPRKVKSNGTGLCTSTKVDT